MPFLPVFSHTPLFPRHTCFLQLRLRLNPHACLVSHHPLIPRHSLSTLFPFACNVSFFFFLSFSYFFISFRLLKN
ncbi:hypothetical protein BDV27DRAFT_3326 [Aspergillus caelatus]|uniref:Uncharacterized protein n=1 Tax=Aspergillus caelatus TaxID=61420 RepID=A0A5N7A359_9EURO|nr:uncharacterized protein BDV27DRAFT_3326 [Aspergillus caelatus]KAE8363868.1 hypothetical protein BDV27DRAFT_3326 [Aspergillus caelatus]